MNELTVTEYKEVRVLTTQQLAEVYGTEPQVIANNFNRNKERYTEGKHYVALTGEEKADFINKNQNDFSSFTRAKAIYLWTEKGAFLHAKSLNTDKAWDVYDRLVESYFRVRSVVNEELSPATRLMLQMANQLAENELKTLEAKKLAERALEATENIKEAVRPVFDNWREETVKKIRKIQSSSGEDFQSLNTKMYKELERRAGCDLNTRLRNRQAKMYDRGCTKTAINNTRKIDCIEEDKKLREIFSKIVSEYEIKYCA